METLYSVIYCSEDGDHTIEFLEKSVLLGRLNEGHWGTSPVFLTASDSDVHLEVLDLDECVGVMIIPGTPIIPYPVEKVKAWELE